MQTNDYIRLSELISMIIADNSAKLFENLVSKSFEDSKNQTVVKMIDVFNVVKTTKESLHNQIMEEIS